ncbi:nuclear transport factor 2 family protein [Variovorax dokdonensis]|uniref:Nuclear transport factor 2 family protein n=1 Tax=Variovorax dokdonensis TaxID=344883 RepID=A0ABT7N4M4_9BURK|nr:nuclear transport factor 2 family protein [Variovorax dokdonensis]MDM0042886.1 nuclear transport factor 2 family protein [Variovorax dokdonensis]
MSAADLQRLVDREAIRDCMYRYCRGIDRADEAALRSAYWEDATDCHGAWNGSASGFIDQALRKLREGGRRVHQVSSILIELHGDVAAVESAFIALQAPAAAPQRETFLCGRYVDRFERRRGEWRIAARTVVYDWIEERERSELAQDDVQLYGPRQPTAASAPYDPIYRLLAKVREGTLG